MDTAIAIRTAVIKDQTLHIQAGAGVVADSIPALEWKETMNKVEGHLSVPWPWRRPVSTATPVIRLKRRRNYVVDDR